MSGWPDGWIDTYHRFEKFISAQKEGLPESDLEISPTGGIQTSLPAEVDRETHTTVVFYHEGADILEMGLSKDLFGQGRQSFFPPSTYAVCLKTCGTLVGYQFRYPLTWFQTERAKADHFGKDHLTIRVIEPPQPADDYWPNERLLRFCDFLVLPKNNPLIFLRKNHKVTPSVDLAVTNAGVIQRTKLDDSMEKYLRWRIYYNGRLIEKGVATGDLHHATTQGPGTYVAFVGVEGPNGFMPVSNHLQFPLFPERNGSMAVLPTASNGDGVPDFLRDTLAADQMANLRDSVGWQTPHQPYNAATIYGLRSLGSMTDEKKQSLLSLWSAWAWSVDLAKGDPNSEIGRIHIATEAK